MQSNDLLFHNCPKCGVMFELVEGCSDVKCSHCQYNFCWVCGSDNDSCLHLFMKFGCQVINMTFKLNMKSNVLRAVVIFLFVITVLPLTIFLIFSMVPVFIFWDQYNAARTSIKPKRVCLCVPVALCNHIFWNYKNNNKCLLYSSWTLIAIPLWIIIITICITIGTVLTAILIVPAWLLSLLSVKRMIFWWRKRDRGTVKMSCDDP